MKISVFVLALCLAATAAQAKPSRPNGKLDPKPAKPGVIKLPHSHWMYESSVPLADGHKDSKPSMLRLNRHFRPSPPSHPGKLWDPIRREYMPRGWRGCK